MGQYITFTPALPNMASIVDKSRSVHLERSLGIRIENATLQYHDAPTATLSQLNMEIDAGQWTVLLGRSGSGKTTILRHLAGLLDGKVTWSGSLETSDNQVIGQRIAYMAQQDLLLPWLTVIENVCLSERFGSQEKSKPNSPSRDSGYERAMQLLVSVGLADYAQAKPNQLSGGMRQRVALARTLMQNQPLVLMDEPFSALDAVTRHKLQSLAAKLLKDKTVVLITHDPQEAVRLADKLYVLQGSPAYVQSLPVPGALPPRVFDGECAQRQQAILELLEKDYE